MNLKNILKSLIDIILILFLVILSIKKGGFYKTDCLSFNLVIIALGTIYIFCYYLSIILKKYIKKRKDSIKENSYKFDIIELMLLLLVAAYTLPVIFGNYSNLSDSIFEMIRYLNIYIIYFIVKRSNNKKVYVFSILFITLILCFLGIDGISNRYLINILESVDSGYLTTNNLSRMSSTIQYANVFSLICLLSYIYLLDVIKNLKIEKINNNIIRTIKYLLMFLCIFIYFASIILSQSRVILVVCIIYTIYVFINKESKNKPLIFVTLLLSFTYSNLFMKILQINKTYTYILIIVASIILTFIVFIFFNIINKESVINNVKKLRKDIKISVVFKFIFTIIMILFFILIFYIKEPINLNSSANNNSISRNIYNLNKNQLNEVLVNIKPKLEDTRYTVRFFVVNKKLETKQIKSFGYYSNTTNCFKFDYMPDNDFKYMIINIECEKGKLEVTDILINNRKNYIDYLLFPSEIMYRTKDLVNGDTSYTQRLLYIKDAIKISTSSLKNILIGLGGEAFKNTCDMVKESNYSSTEVHNIYIQIFVESGLIGIIIFLAIMILSIKNSKNSIEKLLIIVIYITSLFDLNFSFMIVMCIFAILLGIVVRKENGKFYFKDSEKNNLEYLKVLLYNLYYIIAIILSIVVTIILLKANTAYYMRVPKLLNGNIIENEIIESIKIKKKRISLDKSENVYILSLLEDYDMCLNINESHFQNKTEKINIILDLEKRLIDLKNNDKYNIDTLLKCIQYFRRYMKELVDIKFSENIEYGYEYYTNLIISNLEEIETMYSNEDYKNTLKEEYKKLYNDIYLLNTKLNSKKIDEIFYMLEKKVMY